jgi:hypothetical protein
MFCASTNILGSWRTHVSSAPALRGSRQGSSVTRRNWEYLVEDAYNDSAQAQRVLNQGDREGWELVWASKYYYFKRVSTATSKGRPTWEYIVEDAYNDPGQAQRVLNQSGREGWEFVERRGNYYFFKRVASQGRPTWEYIVEDAYNDPGQAQRVLNQRGGEGWEFVERFGDYYYLKRAGIATSKGRQTWEYLVDGAYNDSGQGQRVLNQRGREGWDFVLRVGDYYYLKRASVATGKGRPTWEYLVKDGYSDPGQAQRVFNELGSEGWEFVETDGSSYYLKRASIASTTNREAEEDGRNPAPRPSRREQITLEYNVYYLCNGERVMVTRCRKDSDQPGFPPTQPNQDYCQVSYPDRPKRGGFDASGVELRGDLIKKLQECTR